MPELEYVEQKLRPAWVKEVLDGIQLLWAGQSDLADRLAGLAERLEKLDQQDDRFLVALEQVGNGHRARLAAIKAKLTPDPFPKEWLKAFSAAQSKPNQSLTSKKSKPAAARRKAKR